ncbi:MAG: peptidoglycan D,D-transpeptidase FtsI family protein [Candidatus Paceibacteria bacterium]
MPRSEYKQKRDRNYYTRRLWCLAGVFILFGIAVVGRLFFLMVMRHDFYTALAKGSHEVYSELVPERGKIYIKNKNSEGRFPVATNRDKFLLFGSTRGIDSKKQAKEIVEKISQVITLKRDQTEAETSTSKENEKEKTKKQEIIQNLSQKKRDLYIPIKQRVSVSKTKKIKQFELEGIHTLRKSYRFYPEGRFAGPVIGFVGRNKSGEKVGRYGVEGYWNDELNGEGGFVDGVKSATGQWLPTVGSDMKEAINGADITLTLDRAIQYKACKKLRKAKEKYKAEAASLVLMNPKTGAVKAMCSLPDFNPNKYNKVDSISQYNNSTIFKPYEVGSVFKPVVMAAALDKGVIEPDTAFDDPGQIKDLCMTPIRNSREKTYDKTDMTGVLEKSINTGMVFVARKLGKKDMVEYIEDFGFGTKTGIGLDTERPGDISSLYKKSGDEIGCYGATASFGQGITATPLQVAVAYSALANKGNLPRPYIVEKVEYKNGRVETTEPKTIRKVIQEDTSTLIKGMLTSVVKEGHARSAGEKGYFVAGKTGTAQISGKTGGYSEETNHTFVGFAPSNNPKFVLLVKFHKPEERFSASTAAPTFGDVSDFLLDYYQISPKEE